MSTRLRLLTVHLHYCELWHCGAAAANYAAKEFRSAPTRVNSHASGPMHEKAVRFQGRLSDLSDGDTLWQVPHLTPLGQLRQAARWPVPLVAAPDPTSNPRSTSPRLQHAMTSCSSWGNPWAARHPCVRWIRSPERWSISPTASAARCSSLTRGMSVMC